MIKKVLVISLSLLVVLLGFLRDYLFVNINWIYLTLLNGRKNQARNEFHFLLDWQIDSIVNLKWFLTVLFYFLFLSITSLVIHIAFRKKVYNLITIFTFILILGMAGILYGIAQLSDSMDKFYGIIITLTHLAQSFFPLMLLGILFKFLPEIQKRSISN